MGKKDKQKIVRTPNHNIPIGEAVKDEDGHYSLKIKKARSQEVEVIALDQLNMLVMKAAEE